MNNTRFECPICHKFFSEKDKIHISLCKKNNINNHPRYFFQNNNSEIKDDNFSSFNRNRNNGRQFFQKHSNTNANNPNWNMKNLHKFKNNELSISKEQSITFDSVPNDFSNFLFNTLFNDDIKYLPKKNGDVFEIYDKTISSGNNSSLNQFKNNNNEIKNNNGNRREINHYASQNYNKKYLDEMNKYNSNNYRDHRGNNRNYNFRYRGRGGRGRGRGKGRCRGHFNRYNRSNYYRGSRYNNIDWYYNDNNVDMHYNDNKQNIKNENNQIKNDKVKNDEQNRNEFINNEKNRNNTEDDDDFPRNNIFFNYLTNPFLNIFSLDEDNSDDNEDDRFNIFNYYFDDNIIYGFDGFDLLEPKGLSEEKIKSLPKVIFNKDLKKEKERCVICLDDYKEGDELINIPCFHYFHSKCITEWFKNNKNCPICKYEIKEEDQDCDY